MYNISKLNNIWIGMFHFNWESFNLFLFFFFAKKSRSLTMTTSSIFDILRTKMLTLTTAGPSNDMKRHTRKILRNIFNAFLLFLFSMETSYVVCCLSLKKRTKRILTCFVAFLIFSQQNFSFAFCLVQYNEKKTRKSESLGAHKKWKKNPLLFFTSLFCRHFTRKISSEKVLVYDVWEHFLLEFLLPIEFYCQIVYIFIVHSPNP